MQTIRTVGHRYWNPCGSLLAFLWEKIYNVFYSMQSYARSPDGGDGIIIASNYAVTLLLRKELIMVELDVKITSGDLYDFLLRHSYNSVSGLLGAVIGALGVIVGISRQYWIYLILGVVILLYLPWTLFIKSKQQVANNPVFKEPLHYVLDENGITISQGDSSTCQAWEDCLKAVSTGRSIIVYTAKNNATIFPKSQMQDKTTDVIEMISTHMPPAKVKIRS